MVSAEIKPNPTIQIFYIWKPPELAEKSLSHKSFHLIFTLIFKNKQEKTLRYLWSFFFILILQVRKEEALNEELPTTTCMYNHEDHVGSRKEQNEAGDLDSSCANWVCHSMGVPLRGWHQPVRVTLTPSIYNRAWHTAGLRKCLMTSR